LKRYFFLILILAVAVFVNAQMSTRIIKASFDPDNNACAATDGHPECLQYYGDNETWASAALTVDSLATDTTLNMADSSGMTVGKHIYCEGNNDVYAITANNTTTDIITITPALAHDCLTGAIIHEGADPADATAYAVNTVLYKTIIIDITAIVSAEVNIRVMCADILGTWTQVYPYSRLLALGTVRKRVDITEPCYKIVVGVGVATDAGTDAVALSMPIGNIR